MAHPFSCLASLTSSHPDDRETDVRDTSLRVPPGVQGTIVEVRVFNRHGVDKDERAQAIEREEIERLAKDRDDEQAILDRNVYGRLMDMLLGKTGVGGPKGFKKDTLLDQEKLEEFPRSQWWQFALEDEQAMGEIETSARQVVSVVEQIGQQVRQGQSSSQEIVVQVNSVDAVISRANVAAEHTKDFADRIRDLSGRMSGIIARFSIGAGLDRKPLRAGG